MNIFEIALSPFIFIIKQIFLFSYGITNDYGASIILLSFAISLLLLPVFILIEKAKKKDDALKLKMKPLVDEIKRCYKGQERYYYLKTLNRQHNYSPFRALFPVLSLLLQIPFFIAAYQFLENFTPLQGVSFLFIDDLSLPDGLFGAVNILPIAMTIVNLLTAYFYTRDGDASERKQMIVVAGIFLVLLFNLPSGLVLYWTMNNVFSFLRLFITNPEVFKKRAGGNLGKLEFADIKNRASGFLPKLKVTFIVLLVLSILSQLNWAFGNDFNDIYFRILAAIGVSFFATLLLALLLVFYIPAITLPSTGFKQLVIQLWPTFKSLFIVIASVAILSQINWAFQFYFSDLPLRIVLAMLASVVLTGLLAFIVLAYYGYVKMPKGTFKFCISCFGPVYVGVFVVLTTLSVWSQVNWALQFYFNDIVLRLSLAVAGSWLLVVVLANAINNYKKNRVRIAGALKTYFINSRKILLPTWLILTIIAVGSQVNWALQFDFDDIVFRLVMAIISASISAIIIALLVTFSKNVAAAINSIRVKPAVFFGLLFLSGYFYFASIYYFSGINYNLGIAAIVFLIPVQFIGHIYFNKYRALNRSWYVKLHAVLLLFLLAFQCMNLWVIIDGNELNFTTFNIGLLISKTGFSGFILIGLFYVVSLVPYFIRQSKFLLLKPSRQDLLVLFLSSLYLAGFVFIWNPLLVYSSFPDAFGFAAVQIFSENIMQFIVSIISILFIYYVLPFKLKPGYVVLIFSLALIGFFHNTIMPINMGTLQGSKFEHGDNLNLDLVFYLFEGFIILGMVALVYFLFKEKYTKGVAYGMLLLNLVLIAQSLSAALAVDSFWKVEKIPIADSHTITFSKDKHNVVYLILDMFQGWYYPEILKNNPELKEGFSDFTYYPNTLSISNYTASSMPAMLGGYDFTPDKLDEDSVSHLGKKMIAATEAFQRDVKSRGYHLASTPIPYSRIDTRTYDTYLPFWKPEWDRLKTSLNIGISYEIGFSLLWANALFYTAPYFLKPIIYNDGRWFLATEESNANSDLAKPYNFLRALPLLSDTKCEDPAFSLIWTFTTHFPWDKVDDDGNFVPDIGPYENNRWALHKVKLWIDWMKENGVYDNTKIIIVSDHGIRTSTATDTIMRGSPYKWGESSNSTRQEQLAFSPLLLVKDFNATGANKVDDRFMCNVDAIDIVLNRNDPTKIEPPLKRSFNAYWVSWRIKVYEDKQYPITKSFIVKDNIYDAKNWQRTR